MMHEYRLYTTIPQPRRSQILNILAGVTASQPVPTTQQVLIYQQLKPESAPAVKKGQAKPTLPVGQQQRLNYVKLVRDVWPIKSETEEEHTSNWRLREEGLPDPAAKTVISQAVTERELDAAETDKFRAGSESHKYVAQYISAGTRFVHHNTVIHMTRLHSAPIATDREPLDAQTPAIENSALIDASGAWLVEVCVRVDDGGNSGLRDKAVKELDGFKRELEGAMDLRVPDRLALDPRVK